MAEHSGEIVTTEMVQEEGGQDRRFYGIDGTMGDAQDVPHPYVGSIYGEWCSLCGLNRSHRAHKRWAEQAALSGSSGGER